MGWRVLHRVLDAADMSGAPTVYQKVIFNSDVVLSYLQTWFEVYNDPAFDNLYFQWYSLDGITPRKLICTSTNTILKASSCTSAYGRKGYRFDFGNAAFKGTSAYALVPRGTNYVPTSTKYLGWMIGWPDPAYRTNLVLSSVANAGRAPYSITGFVGASL